MAVHNPVGDNYQKALTNSSTQVADPIPQQTDTLRVVNHSGNGIHVAIGNTPTASSSNYFMDKHTEAFLSLGPVLSQRVVSITKGSTTVLAAPEGTQMPFNLGDRVTLDYEGDSTNDSNYTTLINDTKVVGKSRSAGVGGDFEEKITVEANTAGVSTAFTPTGNATLFMSNKVSVISPNSDANSVVQIQQVQTTGSA